MKKIFNSNAIKKMFLGFLLIQPPLDLNILYTKPIIDFFHFSPSTIFRIIMFCLLAMLLIISKWKAKSTKKLILYLIIAIVYAFLHHINAYYYFTANITGTFNYSIINEFLYLIRMFIPILIIFISNNLEISSKNVKNIIGVVTFVFSTIIILGSIFKFGIISYGNVKVTYGFLDLFKKIDFSIYEFATRGLFAGSNRIGIILSSFLPINIYYYFKDKNNLSTILILLQVVALILVGTTVATYTWIMIIFVMLILLFISVFLSKEKLYIYKIIFLIIILFIGYYLISLSPITKRKVGNDFSIDAKLSYDNNELNFKNNMLNKNIAKLNEEKLLIEKDNSSLENQKVALFNEKLKKLKTEYLKNNYEKYYIQSVYILDIYNYEYDYDFWIDVINIPFEKRNNGRITQKLISDRVLENNNNKWDYVFGMGYSRFKSSDLYLERDILVQFYTCGIIGVLLFFAPYIVILIKVGIFLLKDLKKHFNLEVISYCFSITLFISLGIVSGHVLDEMITYIFIAFISGVILKKIQKKEKSYEKEKVTVIIPIYNVEKYLDECLKSLVNQTYGLDNIEVIMVEDCSTDKSLEICYKYQKKYKFELIKNKTNLGVAETRNRGIKIAKGKYICFLDSDDCLYENAIEDLYNEIIRTDADIVIAQLNAFDQNGEKGYYSDKYLNIEKNGTIYENQELLNCISICSKIYKTSLVKEVSFLKNVKHEDNSFSIIIYFKASKIAVLPKYLYHRRIRETNDSIMQNLNYKTFLDLIKNFKYILLSIKNHKIPNHMYFFMVRKLNNNMIQHVSKIELRKAKKQIENFIDNLLITNFKKSILKIYSKYYFKIAFLAKKIK